MAHSRRKDGSATAKKVSLNSPVGFPEMNILWTVAVDRSCFMIRVLFRRMR